MRDKKKGVNYMHYRDGDIIKIEVRDPTYKVIYRQKFNVKDKNAMLRLVGALEKFTGFSVIDLIREKANVGEWF